MSNNLTVRAWKDATFRSSLNEAERSKIARNPAGDRDLKAADMARPSVRGADQPTLTIISTKGDWCCGL